MKIFRPLGNILAGVLLLLSLSCASKQTLIQTLPEVTICVTNPPNIDITLIESSVPLTCRDKQEIIKRTNLFCKQKGRSPVVELVIYKEIFPDKSRNFAVKYHCSKGEYDYRIFHIR